MRDQHVGRHDRFRKGLWHDTAWCDMEISQQSTLSASHMSVSWRDQCATVLADIESDVFQIARGTKQGDPLSFSVIHLNASVCNGRRWENVEGVRIGDQTGRWTKTLHLKLEIRWRRALTEMMTDFKRSTEKMGLKIHPDKTKIFLNQKSNKQKEVEVNNITVEILPPAGKAKYLAQTITFEQQEAIDRKSRVRCAWSS